MLGALFPPNGRYALLVALTRAPVLLICAKDLFVAAILAGLPASHPISQGTGRLPLLLSAETMAGLVGGEQLLKHHPTFQACHSAPRVGDWPWGDTDGHGMIANSAGRDGLPRTPLHCGGGHGEAQIGRGDC